MECIRCRTTTSAKYYTISNGAWPGGMCGECMDAPELDPSDMTRYRVQSSGTGRKLFAYWRKPYEERLSAPSLVLMEKCKRIEEGVR